MNSPNTTTNGPWRRPKPTAIGPDRRFGGYYRTSDRKLKGKDLRGVPLQTTEDAVVAAVRLGYQVVDAQIERGLDMARRLRGAADRAGNGEPAALLDNAERLISRGLLLGLEFLERGGPDSQTPFMRLLSAQFKMLGAVLGLTNDTPAAKPSARESEKERSRSKEEPAAATQKPRDGRTPKVRHTPGSAKRAITIVRYELDRDVPGIGEYEVAFHGASAASHEAMSATLFLQSGGAGTLQITTLSQYPAGRWRGAVCDPAGEQVGIIEIEL